jgi:hypothetical protein
VAIVQVETAIGSVDKGSALEWAMARSALSDVRVRLAVRLAPSPASPGGGEPATPCSLCCVLDRVRIARNM